MAVLQFDAVRRSFEPDSEVLKGVGFGLEAGEVVSLLGRNGAGKTTLINIAMGMLEPHEGAVRVFGIDPRRDPVAVKRRVGYVSEDQILPPFLRVGEVVDLHRTLYPSWDDRLATELADRFEISARTRIKRLSRGQARQVALLCAVSHRPELLLLDEPAGGLDPVARREFLETAIQLLNDTGTTILFSSHYMTDVERLASRIVLLHRGTVLLDHGLDELREEFCLALIPDGEAVSPDRLSALPSCVGARRRSDTLRAVFHLDPDRARAVVARELEIPGATCRPVALEEMFIELVGGSS
jgi:ABC-2 type transport system ATP-binding protein